MINEISKLLEYQQADLKVEAEEKKVKSSNERKTANLMKQRYELAVEERKKLIARRDEAEKEIAAAQAEVEKLTSLADIDRVQNAPEDTDALKKLLADVDKLTSSLTKLENKLNKVNADVEANEKKINEYASVANKSREEFNTNKAEYEKILAAVKPEIDRLKAERDKLEKGVNPTFLAKYKALKKNKIVPTAPLNDRRCGGCHMEMPSFTVSNALKNGYCECENCGRIVYVE